MAPSLPTQWLAARRWAPTAQPPGSAASDSRPLACISHDAPMLGDECILQVAHAKTMLNIFHYCFVRVRFASQIWKRRTRCESTDERKAVERSARNGWLGRSKLYYPRTERIRRQSCTLLYFVKAGAAGSLRGGGCGAGGLVVLQLEACAEGSQHQLNVCWLGVVSLQVEGGDGVGLEVRSAARQVARVRQG